MNNKILSIICIAFFLFFNTNTFANNKPGGEGEFELWGEGGHNKFKGTWKVYSLMGEPVKVLHVKWMATTSIDFENSIYSSTAMGCSYIPQEVINKVTVVDFKIIGYVNTIGINEFLTYSSAVVLVISGDVLAKPGFETYGENNLTVPASPDWGSLFKKDIFFLMPSVSEQEAKAIMKARFTLNDIRIHKIKYNYLPVRTWLSNNKDRCEKKEEEKEDGTLDQLADYFNEVTSEATDFESALESMESSDDGDFGSQLAQVDGYRDELKRQRIELERKRREALIESFKRNGLQITTPVNGASTDKRVVTLKGKVDVSYDLGRPTSLTLTYSGVSQQVSVNSDGSFTNPVVLAHGQNDITVKLVTSVATVIKTVSVIKTGIPSKFRVTLIWDKDRSDIDLHVIDSQGRRCKYNNNVVGNTHLDVDDTNGFGPENITNEQATSGQYKIEVQNYSNGVGATAKVYIFKEEALQSVESHRFRKSKEIWKAGTIRMGY